MIGAKNVAGVFVSLGKASSLIRKKNVVKLKYLKWTRRWDVDMIRNLMIKRVCFSQTNILMVHENTSTVLQESQS